MGPTRLSQMPISWSKGHTDLTDSTDFLKSPAERKEIKEMSPILV